MLDKAAGTLTVPPTMHLDQLIEIDTPESLLPRLSEEAELTVLGHDHPALGGHMPFGTASTVASMSRHPVVAVPRGWAARADDRRPIAVAVDGLHPSSSTLGFAFTEASLRQVPVLVVHSAPLAELSSSEQDTRLNSGRDPGRLEGRQPRHRRRHPAASWCAPATQLTQCRLTCNCWSSAAPTAAENGPAGSARLPVPYLIGPPVRSRSFHSSIRALPTAD